MKQEDLARRAFSTSTKGRILVAVEWCILTVVLSVSMMYVLYEASAPTEDQQVLSTLLFTMTIFGFVLGLLIGAMWGLPLVSWKLFPPSKSQVVKYKENYRKELIEELRTYEKIGRNLRQRLRELDELSL